MPRLEQSEAKPQGAPLRKPIKESIMELMAITTGEMVTIATLKKALADYLSLDDIYDYSLETGTAYYCVILGQLEMSLIRRKQSLDKDRKALLELEK
jgi:hypothetical protein